ncbi:retrovirus-related Pol polyprotein from transposon opus [Trichonephila clavipes]|nr:retrovirus-related Pol polyprotein from transposon opus [Trichonephila clavipes]
MWLYYCKLREANDFESVNQLIVADKMFEMLDSETATHIGVLQGEEWYKPRDLGKQCDIFYASKGKSYDESERAKWNDSEKRSFNGSWGKQPFGEKKSDNFSSRKNFDKGQVTEIKKFACFTCGSDKHFKRDCPKNKEVDNKRLNVNKVSTEGTELVDGTVAARVDLLGKVIPRGAIEDKLSKLVKTSISVDGKLFHVLLDSGTEITVIKKDLVPGISVEGASTIYLKGIFGPAVKCPLVYVPIGLATGGQVNVVHQQVLCALAEVLVEDVLLPPEVLDMLGGVQSEENSLAQSSQDLRVDSGNVDETEVSLGILPEKAQEHIEDSQRNITSCQNEVGTLGTKDEEVTAEMDKGSMVADSFRSEQECCAELALVWKQAKEGKGNYYEVDGYLFHRDKILGESIGQLVIPKCRRTEVLRLAHTSVFSSHMGPKKTLERIKYSFFWEGLRADVKKFCESCKECQLTQSVRIKDRSSSTPVARPELPLEVGNMDLIGPIDPPSLKGHKYILRLVDQHTRWGEAVPLTSLSAKVTCEAWLNIFSRTEIYLLSKWEGFVEKNSAASIWNHFLETESAGRRPGQGRRRATTPNEDRYLVLTARRHRNMNATLFQQYLRSATGTTVSTQTVRNRLHGVDLYARRPLVCVRLTSRHRRDRRDRDGPLTARRYRDEILRSIVVPYAAAIGDDFILMDDNCRPHRANLMEDSLFEEGIVRMELTACFPDMNPIEHVWDALGRRVAGRQPPPQTLQELERDLVKEWDRIPQLVINSLIDSMP